MLDCVTKFTLLPVKTNYLYYQIILNDFTFHNFINCPVFIDVKLTLYHEVAIELISERHLFFMHCCLIFVSHFFAG